MKLWRWLCSRPLARVRRNLATQKRIQEMMAYHDAHRGESWGKYR